MRLLLFALGALFAAALIATPAAAQNYPWCSNFADGDGGTNCGFTTHEQCMATIGGSGGFCQKNDWYKPAAAAAPPRHRERGHRSHNSS